MTIAHRAQRNLTFKNVSEEEAREKFCHYFYLLKSRGYPVEDMLLQQQQCCVPDKYVLYNDEMAWELWEQLSSWNFLLDGATVSNIEMAKRSKTYHFPTNPNFMSYDEAKKIVDKFVESGASETDKLLYSAALSIVELNHIREICGQVFDVSEQSQCKLPITAEWLAKKMHEKMSAVLDTHD